MINAANAMNFAPMLSVLFKMLGFVRGRWIASSGTQQLHNASQALLEEIIHQVATRMLGPGKEVMLLLDG